MRMLGGDTQVWPTSDIHASVTEWTVGLPLRRPWGRYLSSTGGSVDGVLGDERPTEPEGLPPGDEEGPGEDSAPVGELYKATRYGEQYNGGPLYCGGTYWSDDIGILAINPQYHDWPCGTRLEVCAPLDASSTVDWSDTELGDLRDMRCIGVVRVDTCPGCGPYHLDLSESGIAVLCGGKCDYIEGLVVR